jgi:hypothetical protein
MLAAHEHSLEAIRKLEIAASLPQGGENLNTERIESFGILD